jgi:hypothetical protein
VQQKEERNVFALESEASCSSSCVLRSSSSQRSAHMCLYAIPALTVVFEIIHTAPLATRETSSNRLSSLFRSLTRANPSNTHDYRYQTVLPNVVLDVGSYWVSERHAHARARRACVGGIAPQPRPTHSHSSDPTPATHSHSSDPTPATHSHSSDPTPATHSHSSDPTPATLRYRTNLHPPAFCICRASGHPQWVWHWIGCVHSDDLGVLQRLVDDHSADIANICGANAPDGSTHPQQQLYQPQRHGHANRVRADGLWQLVDGYQHDLHWHWHQRRARALVSIDTSHLTPPTPPLCCLVSHHPHRHSAAWSHTTHTATLLLGLTPPTPPLCCLVSHHSHRHSAAWSHTTHTATLLLSLTSLTPPLCCLVSHHPHRHSAAWSHTTHTATLLLGLTPPTPPLCCLVSHHPHRHSAAWSHTTHTATLLLGLTPPTPPLGCLVSHHSHRHSAAWSHTTHTATLLLGLTPPTPPLGCLVSYHSHRHSAAWSHTAHTVTLLLGLTPPTPMLACRVLFNVHPHSCIFTLTLLLLRTLLSRLHLLTLLFLRASA